MRRALVCGAGGFIASHLVKRLKKEGYWVRGADQKLPEFAPTAADDFAQVDLRDPDACQAALALPSGSFDEVYQLAADMGGMGFIHSAECEIMRNNALININVVDAASRARVDRYFFSSSVCVYRDMAPGEPELTEEQAYPALPDNEYGWEKLYAERTALAYARRSDMQVRIARFQNCYGPEGTWAGGREKAPAAICRKVAEAPDGGTIPIWGDGSAIRSYIYVDDIVDGIFRLTHSDVTEPANIGSPEYVSVLQLVQTVADVAGKRISTAHVDGPVGVRSRNFSNDRMYSIGWRPRFSLREGIERTYPWVETQVRTQRTSDGQRATEIGSDGRASSSHGSPRTARASEKS
jgi:nucleoside-diphosphate-sugar epimerase